jgi:hypothetical protein
LGYFSNTPWAKSFYALVIGRVLLMAKNIDLNCNTLYQSWSKGWNEAALPLSRYLENALGLITYILNISKVLYNPTKNLEGNQYLN